MSSAGFIGVPLKKSYEVDLAQPIASFISATYSEDCPVDKEAPNELQKLRNKATCQPLDKHESSLELLYRYYDQLMAIEAKLPMTQTQIPVPFKWKDAFDKGSLFFGKASLTLSAGSYEKACVLFNIAALQSQVGANQRPDSDEELKLAAKLFQMSAGSFNTLKDSVLSLIPQEPTMDLMPDTLSALSVLMLAQGQEAIYLKASKDGMKPGIRAKIAAQAAELYQDAYKQLSRDTLKGLWERDWLSTVLGKQMAFQGLAQYQQALVAQEKKEIGEELARLTDANAKMQAARKSFGPNSSTFHDEANAVTRAYEVAKKDNDFIYHERIPDLKSLPAVQKAQVAKLLPPTSPMFSRFKDLFESLVPVAVHQALAAYDSRKSQILNSEIGRMREATQLMNGVLASLNLPAAIDDVCNKETLPESIRDKSNKVRAAGGIDAINRMMNELPSLLGRNKEIIEETSRLLNEEKSVDEANRNQYKERWTRMASEKITETLWQETGKYRQVLETAQRADGIVKQKFESHREGMEILSKSEGELKSAIPGGGESSGNAGSPSVLKLKELMGEVRAIQEQREGLERELKETNFDMASVFLRALAESGAVNEEQLSTEKLNDLFAPLRTRVSEGLQQQERVMAEVQRVNQQFCQEKAGGGGAERERVLKMLATAHDAFMELRANLQEGSKFYNDLTPLLVRLQQKVSDFCFARKTEMDDLLKDLKQAPQAAQPPPRPPPPATTTTTTAQAPPPSNPFTGSPATAPMTNPFAAPPATTTATSQAYPQNPPAAVPLQYRPSVYSASYGQMQQPPYPGGAPPYPQQQQYPGYTPMPQPSNAPYPPAGGYAYQQQPGQAPQMPPGYNPYQQQGYPPQQQGQGYPQGYPPQSQAYPYGQNWPTM